MGASSVNTDINILSELCLDGTELYLEDGETVADLEVMEHKEILELLEDEKC